MKVYCGTNRPVRFEIDIEDYAQSVPTNADAVIRDKAIMLLQSTMFDKTFADDGHRNEDAVNACIALHVLGFDPEVWFENFFERNNQDWKFFDRDISKFMDHVVRVNHYVGKWGPTGDEGAALGYAIAKW